eukprot:c7974_g1_i1.p1 GENE.c7974_g1_i1~~c7974_g1_i1.p1  ORF type:complete len:641 (+),score=151.28 c7974_g1_i1:92-2014(+)
MHGRKNITRKDSDGSNSTPEGAASDNDYDDAAGFDSPQGERRHVSSADAHMRSDILSRVGKVLTDQKRVDHQLKQKRIEEEKDREQKRDWRWSKALDELLATERKYVKDLDLIRRVFIAPLMQSIEEAGPNGKPILDAKLVQTIFSDIEIFFKLHEDQFLPGLEDAVKNGGLEVGKFFISRASFLKMYTSFINKHEEIIALLSKEESENTAFRNFKQKCYELPECEKLKLNDFLIKPLHRLTRYTLLLRELEKNCKPDLQRVKMELNTAITKVSAVTSLVNDRVRDAENRRKVVSISEELQNVIPNLIQPARRYVADCSFQNFNDGTVGPAINVYVFNDLVVTATKTKDFFKETYSVKQFEIMNMLLQVNLVTQDAKVQAVRFFNKDSTCIDVCSENTQAMGDLITTLLRQGVQLEGAPYPPSRPVLKFPECTIVLFGDKDCGKNGFIQTLFTSKSELYSAAADDDAALPMSREHSRDHTTAEDAAVNPFTMPISHFKMPHDVTILDTFSDERLSPTHKASNRELWKRADVMVFFLNLDKDYKTDYWKSELSQAQFKRGAKPPLVVITAHDTTEPKKTDPASVAVCRTLGAVTHVACLTTHVPSVEQALSETIAQVAKAKEQKRPSSLTILGVEVFSGKS